MEDMLSSLLTLAIIILSIVAKVKKNQKKAAPAAKKAPVQQASPAEIPRAAAPAIPVQQAIPVSPMPAPVPMQAAAPVAPATPKAPAPARMGPEGEDACHEYMLDEQRPAGGIPALQEDEQQSEAARDLVRGVIIGEILRRPAVKRYGRQA